MKVGGFFPLELPSPVEGNVWSLWGLDDKALCMRNARSALNLLIALRNPNAVWLPAYSCPALAQSVPPFVPVRFFPLDKDLSPDVAYLRTHVKKGDMVVAIDYFGRPPAADFCVMAVSTPDIIWVEDRAQAMHTGEDAWGGYELYSPRKLIGVPDGGILASKNLPLPVLENAFLPAPDFIHASLLRAEDATEAHNDQWYAANRTYENTMGVEDIPMSRISRAILKSTDARPLMEARRTNHTVLQEMLPDLAALERMDGDYVPFGFPIRVKESDRIANTLHAEGIFVARHWPELPSDAQEFHHEHVLARHMITLPVDHRYNPQQMEMMAKRVRMALR